MTIPLEWTTNYDCKLSKSYQDIALNELREDETRRTQALEQFRDWIKKHPFIKSCRTGLTIHIHILKLNFNHEIYYR